MPPNDAPGPAAARDGAPEPEYVSAPIRTLAPGIEQSDDTCDGRPRIAGTRIPTRQAVTRRRVLLADGAAADGIAGPVADHFGVGPVAVQVAVAFEAGRAWERARRAARKRTRLAKRWREGEVAAKGAGDGAADAL